MQETTAKERLAPGRASMPPAMAPRKAPAQERSRRRYEAMLDAFAALLVESSFDSITTHHVAQRANVPVGTLYQFFPNKFALAAALSRRYEEMFKTHVDARLDAVEALPELEDVIDRLIDGVAQLLFADPSIIRLWAVTQTVPELAPVREEVDALTVEISRNVLSPYLPSLDAPRVDAIATTMSRTVYALLFAAGNEGVEEREQSLVELRQILKCYLRHYT